MSIKFFCCPSRLFILNVVKLKKIETKWDRVLLIRKSNRGKRIFYCWVLDFSDFFRFSIPVLRTFFLLSLVYKKRQSIFIITWNAILEWKLKNSECIFFVFVWKVIYLFYHDPDVWGFYHYLNLGLCDKKNHCNIADSWYFLFSTF